MTDRIIALCILCLVFGLPLGVAAVFTGELILDFVFFWPLFMSVLWITGGLYFWFQLERHWPWGEDTPPPTLPGNPLISILIPCFNEEKNARETISAALAQRYANLEVIAINDGSSDNTAQVLQQLAQEEPRLRVIHLAANQGKAVALKAGAAAARGDLLVCIDGDALLDRDTAAWLVAPLIHYPHVGAGHRQSADPHPIHADRPHSGWGVLVDHWAYQTDAADLWPGLYRLRRNRRLPAPGAGGRRLLEPGYDH